MISTRWLEKRKPHWTKLESLLAQSSTGGLKSLSRSDLQELSLLYRQTAADLAAIREDRASVHFARYVNQLLLRAHNTIYSGHRASPRTALSFFVDAYPAAFRRHLKHVALATVIFAIAAIFGAILTYQNPDFKVKLLGPQMVETIDRHQMWTHSIVGIKPVASSAIMTNNMSVGFTTFALGITGGLGTIYMMAFNGLMIGVIGMACFLSGMSLQLWSFVAPHGVLELPAIFIAGGAGFRIAQGLAVPRNPAAPRLPRPRRFRSSATPRRHHSHPDHRRPDRSLCLADQPSRSTEVLDGRRPVRPPERLPLWLGTRKTRQPEVNLFRAESRRVGCPISGRFCRKWGTSFGTRANARGADPGEAEKRRKKRHCAVGRAI